jgi:hypothetical protein
LKKQGWLPADATALQTALATLSGVVLNQDEALADRVQFTAELTRAANPLYKLCQACQNAARLQYPETQPRALAARARFLLDTFPHATTAPPNPLRPRHPQHRIVIQLFLLRPRTNLE